MKRLLYPILLFSILLLTSCAFHSGMMTGNASLGENDFHILTVAVGTAKTTHVFGIGGLDKDALVYEAKKNLYRTYPLSKNQAYANVSVDFKRSMYFVVFRTVATVTADLVQFGSISKADSIKYLSNNTLQKNPDDGVSAAIGLFYPGQVVNLYDNQKMVPVRILEKVWGKEKYTVEYMKPKISESTKVKYDEIYLTGKNDSIPGTDFRVGDVVHFKIWPNTSTQTGVIFALGTKYLIVKSGVMTYKLKLEDCEIIDELRSK